MKIKDYILGKYKDFGGVPSSHEVKAVLLKGDLDGDAELTHEVLDAVERAFVRRIPELLLRPTGVSELGVSLSRASTEALRLYYRAKCRELGLENILDDSEKPRVTVY